MFKALLLSLLLQGCAHEAQYRYWYTQRTGIEVFDYTGLEKSTFRSPSRWDIETVIDYIILALPVTFDQAYFNGYSIFITPDWVKVHTEDRHVILADGYTDPVTKRIFISYLRPCIADSALLHELAHILRPLGFDRNHEDNRYWNWVRSLELNAIQDLCPPGYISPGNPPPIP